MISYNVSKGIGHHQTAECQRAVINWSHLWSLYFYMLLAHRIYLVHAQLNYLPKGSKKEFALI